MKVVKRDGKFVDYEREKIRIAITKANAEVPPKKRATDSEIDSIIEYIESLDKKRILVEDIQDIIEEKLMEFGHYELAKKYIVYRYTRALVRKANTTDESILNLMKRNNRNALNENSNPHAMVASTQRNLIAGEVSKDLTKRILLPEKITKAYEEGLLYFHKSDYFIHPMIDCCVVNFSDLLEHGTVLNGKRVDSPKTFEEACLFLVNVISSIQACQYGPQGIFISSLGKYLRNSYEVWSQFYEKNYKGKVSDQMMHDFVQESLSRELKKGVHLLFQQTNLMMTMDGTSPLVTFFLDLSDDDPYKDDVARIIEEMLNQNLDGMKDFNGHLISYSSPHLVYVLKENNILNGGSYDYLTHLAIQNTLSSSNLCFLSSKKLKDFTKKSLEGKFCQGKVSINLPNLALQANKDEKRFFELLEERLELCYEALMCRHYSLLGTTSNVSPIHFQYGALARLASFEKIDLLLKERSCLALGYVGILEMTKLMTGEFHNQEKGKAFALKVIQFLKQSCVKWTQETGIEFVLSSLFSKEEQVGSYFVYQDREHFGIVKGITDKESYALGYHFDSSFFELDCESEFQSLSLSGMITIPVKKEEIESLISYLFEHVLYIKMEGSIKC